jgi:hypothetical protein
MAQVDIAAKWGYEAPTCTQCGFAIPGFTPDAVTEENRWCFDCYEASQDAMTAPPDVDSALEHESGSDLP